MEALADAASWVANNESLLSGLAALIVVMGVVFTPVGVGLRRFLAGSAEPVAATSEPRPSESSAVEKSAKHLQTNPSIAVLPFSNMSNDPEQEHLADGMTEDVITGLSANGSLHVVARNSSFAYKGQSPDIREVGRQLSVRYVLEGSLRKVGDRIRTTVQLIEAETGTHLWADKVDRDRSDIDETQDEVIAGITAALNAQIMSAEYRRARRDGPEAMDAWALVQRGLAGFVHGSGAREDALEILRDVRAAVDLDPKNAYARCALAWVSLVCGINGFTDEVGPLMRDAQENLRLGMQSAANDPMALYFAGAAQIYSGRHEQALRTLRGSLNLNPHHTDALIHLALAHGYLGHYVESHAAFDRAEILAPTGGISSIYGWYRGIVLGFEGRYEESIALIRDHLEHFSRYAAARVTMGLDLAAMGRTGEARAAIIKAYEMDPGIYLNGLSLMVGAHPDPETGRVRVETLREMWPES